MNAKTKNAAKAATKVLATAVLTFPEPDAKKLHALVMADFKAVQTEEKAGKTATVALQALLTGIDYANPRAVYCVLADLAKVYGAYAPAKLAIRKTLINNAAKVVIGGSKDKVKIAGRGMPALLSAIEGKTNINELRAAVSEAKPEALKEATATTGSKAAKRAPVKPETKAGTPTTWTAPMAFQAAIDIVKRCEVFLDAGSDSDGINIAEQFIQYLNSKMNAARLAKAA